MERAVGGDDGRGTQKAGRSKTESRWQWYMVSSYIVKLHICNFLFCEVNGRSQWVKSKGFVLYIAYPHTFEGEECSGGCVAAFHQHRIEDTSRKQLVGALKSIAP